MKDDKEMRIFRLNLLNLLAEKGLSQTELATRLNTSRATVNNWATGTARPNIGKIGLIADALGVSREYLLTDHTEKKAEPVTVSVTEKAGVDDAALRRLMAYAVRLNGSDLETLASVAEGLALRSKQ